MTMIRGIVWKKVRPDIMLSDNTVLAVNNLSALRSALRAKGINVAIASNSTRLVIAFEGSQALADKLLAEPD